MFSLPPHLNWNLLVSENTASPAVCSCCSFYRITGRWRLLLQCCFQIIILSQPCCKKNPLLLWGLCHLALSSVVICQLLGHFPCTEDFSTWCCFFFISIPVILLTDFNIHLHELSDAISQFHGFLISHELSPTFCLLIHSLFIRNVHYFQNYKISNFSLLFDRNLTARQHVFTGIII